MHVTIITFYDSRSAFSKQVRVSFANCNCQSGLFDGRVENIAN